MAELRTANGFTVLVDECDLATVEPHRWMARRSNRSETLYAATWLNGRTVYMHRHILGCKVGEPPVDHINSDGLDNRRANLRSVTHLQNQQNRKLYRTNTSGFKGVSWDKKNGAFQANIYVYPKRISLGNFASAQEAADAYDAAAVRHFGAFAKTNRELLLAKTAKAPTPAGGTSTAHSGAQAGSGEERTSSPKPQAKKDGD